MRYIKQEILRALYAKSGNQCAFPGCTHPIFNEKNKLIAQVCHIEAVSPNGQRYNPEQYDVERNSFGNLLIMCYRHHKETDDVEEFSVEKLKDIKRKHEAKFDESGFDLDDEQLKQLVDEINDYWERIDYLNNQELVAEEYKIDINSNAKSLELLNEIESCLNNISSLNDGIAEEYKTELFETVCLGIPNNITEALTKLEQLKVRELESRVLVEPDNEDIQLELLFAREKFEESAKTSGIAD